MGIGYDDSLGNGAIVVEWGDKFPEALPAGAIRLSIEILAERRTSHSRRAPTVILSLDASTARGSVALLHDAASRSGAFPRNPPWTRRSAVYRSRGAS